MVSLARDAQSSGALFELNGTVANNATWSEDIYFTEEGSAMDISGLDWKMTFRSCGESDTADFTLAIGSGLSIVEDADAGVDRILRITVAPGTLSSYSGDYVCDLASQDVADVVTLWAHGTVSFRSNPVTF